MELKCATLAKLFVIASMHACVWIPGSDYSYVKYRVVVVAFVECDATLLRMEREDRPNFSHT